MIRIRDPCTGLCFGRFGQDFGEPLLPKIAIADSSRFPDARRES